MSAMMTTDMFELNAEEIDFVSGASNGTGVVAGGAAITTVGAGAVTGAEAIGATLGVATAAVGWTGVGLIAVGLVVVGVGIYVSLNQK